MMTSTTTTSTTTSNSNSSLNMLRIKTIFFTSSFWMIIIVILQHRAATTTIEITKKKTNKKSRTATAVDYYNGLPQPDPRSKTKPTKVNSMKNDNNKKLGRSGSSISSSIEQTTTKVPPSHKNNNIIKHNISVSPNDICEFIWDNKPNYEKFYYTDYDDDHNNNDDDSISTQQKTNLFALEGLLPKSEYPILHNTCFFIQTHNIDKHKHLLKLYPNSWIVISTPTISQSYNIDIENRIITIKGIEEYKLLWKKTGDMWDVISTEFTSSTTKPFQNCDWFFKVDTDSFINLHLLEQMLRIYQNSEDHHYIGYVTGNYKLYGEKPPPTTSTSIETRVIVNLALGAFYGFSRSILLKWKEWNEPTTPQNSHHHIWGDYVKTEDVQVAFFLRKNAGVCLDIPFNDKLQFKKVQFNFGKGNGLVEDTKIQGSSLREDITIDECKKVIKKMIDNPCFTWAHRVPLQWISSLTGVLAAHVINQSKCMLVDESGGGGTRMVNNTAYHRIITTTTTTTTQQCGDIQHCNNDPCLIDQHDSSCCGWVPVEE